MQLKFKYRLLIIVTVWLAIAITAYPAWIVGEHLMSWFNIPQDTPLNEHDLGLLWSVLFFIEAAGMLIFFYALFAFLLGLLNHWSKVKCIDIFFKNKYPRHWCK